MSISIDSSQQSRIFHNVIDIRGSRLYCRCLASLRILGLLTGKNEGIRAIAHSSVCNKSIICRSAGQRPIFAFSNR